MTTQEDLQAELSRSIRGSVRFDRGARALYATDASNYRRVPIGVVVPDSVEDAVRAIEVCRRFGAPILSRGGGTSLAGQCCNAAVVLDFSKSAGRVLEIDPGKRLARVEPGAVLDDLRARAERHGLTFGPDPATHATCTLGGMIGNDSCGVHSLLARLEGEGGRTADNVAELEIATYDGARFRVGPTSDEDLARIVAEGGRRAAIYSALVALRDRHADRIRRTFPKIPRRVSGFNLPALLPENGLQVARALAGSEGTCVTILEATVQLVPSPPARALLVAGFPDVFEAADAVPLLLEHRPIGLEGMDDGLVADMKGAGLHADGVALLPEGRGWLLVEFGGATREDADSKARAASAVLSRATRAASIRLVDRAEDVRALWRVRESGLAATAHPPGKALTWEGWEDAAVAPERLGAYLRDQSGLWKSHGYRGDLYGHFGEGCVHTRVDFDLESAEGVRRFRAFLDEAADLVVSYGGSLSGEHGDGQARAELLPRMFGDELVGAFREFKRIWDPDGKMNPGKVVDPDPIVANLRLAGGRPRPDGATFFRYPEDGGDFGRTALRCVGVGKCRKRDGGTMCPSFMATGEEEHSTRGRARLLFEMLRGDVLDDGWRNEEVRRALDLCLACKACRSECPVGVDMATYKAEFLAHYYAGRRRPRSAYAFGWIDRWLRLASAAPSFANLLARFPGSARLLKTAAGIAPERSLPRLARRSFRRWFSRRGRLPSARPGTRGRVMLWPDTFTNSFAPRIGQAAVEVLEAAGFDVEIPSAGLCCGRPLYDFGMLDRAQHLLGGVLEGLREPIEAGVPIVVLEPSCASVFRHELLDLMPDREDARRLSGQTHLLAGFLARHAPDYRFPTLEGEAIVQTHCHQGSLFGTTEDEAVLGSLGLAVRVLDSGCCGMAGAFGFEREHYPVSVACAERVLLPEIRRTPRETLVLADGFSCREQIAQLAHRPALHLAEALRLSLGDFPAGGP